MSGTLDVSGRKEEIKARLGTTDYNFDKPEHAHITITPEICDTCTHHMCMYGCPAQCFNLVDDKMTFQYEDCVECGTCDVVCTPGSVEWNNPRGGFGVKYKQG